jgi:hypothetical protein
MSSISLSVCTVDSTSSRLDETADALESAADRKLAQARSQIDSAAMHARAAGAQTAGAVVNLASAGVAAAQGVARTAQSAGHAVAATGLAVAGAATWVGEQTISAARSLAVGAAKGFAGIANVLSRTLGDGQQVTVRQLEADPQATRLSARIFAAAGRQLDGAGAAMGTAWSSYVGSVTHLAGAGVNVALAAGHTAAVAGQLARAAVNVNSSGALRAAEYGVRLASAAVRAADQGVEGARELAVLSARFSAGTANLLARPDQPQLEVRAERQLAACRAEVRAWLECYPRAQLAF